MAQVTIRELTRPAELLHVYPGQQQPQDCYLKLDLRDGEFTADWNAEVGNAVPSDVYHGHVRRYYIPVLSAETANDLLRTLAPLAQRVLDSYESRWNGHNHVAVLNEDGEVADATIRGRLEDASEPDLHWADASDWLYDIRSDIEGRLSAGETVDALEGELDGDGTSADQPVLIGLRKHLEYLATTI
jgi:hypothetical protein